MSLVLKSSHVKYGFTSVHFKKFTLKGKYRKKKLNLEWLTGTNIYSFSIIFSVVILLLWSK